MISRISIYSDREFEEKLERYQENMRKHRSLAREKDQYVRETTCIAYAAGYFLDNDAGAAYTTGQLQKLYEAIVRMAQEDGGKAK